MSKPQKTPFDSEEIAFDALRQIADKWKFHTVQTAKCEQTLKYATPGRPTPNMLGGQ